METTFQPRACSDVRLSASPQQSKRFTFWKSQARYRESTRREGTGVRGTHPTECAFNGAPRLRNSTQRRQPKKGFSLVLKAACALPPPRSFASFLSTASCSSQNNGFQDGQNSPRPSARVINSPAADVPRWMWQGRLGLAARAGAPLPHPVRIAVCRGQW